MVNSVPPFSLRRRFGAVAAPGGLRASAFFGLLPHGEPGAPSGKCSPRLESSAPCALRERALRERAETEKLDMNGITENNWLQKEHASSLHDGGLSGLFHVTYVRVGIALRRP
jgi:hypothetical protein